VAPALRRSLARKVDCEPSLPALATVTRHLLVSEAQKPGLKTNDSSTGYEALNRVLVRSDAWAIYLDTRESRLTSVSTFSSTG
jgi:hypothetical protein